MIIEKNHGRATMTTTTDITGRDFYSSSLGDRLIDESRYPEEIVDFLRDEEHLISEHSATARVLVEVGCMDGRFASWAHHRGLCYVGVDVVPRYIEAAKTRARERGYPPDAFQFVLGKAEDLRGLLYQHGIRRGDPGVLVFYPFNSIGNMVDVVPVAAELVDAQLRFVISSYLTTDRATAVRESYYRSCEYQNLRWVYDESGIRFSSSDGLSTAAYHPDYLQRVFRDLGADVCFSPFSSFGASYSRARVD